MSQVRILVGTKKGAFILTSDGKRDKWEVSGPFFAGWEIYHMKGSPVDPERIYVSQTSGWFGQLLQASNDGGKTWFQPGVKPEDATPQWPPVKSNRFAYDSSAETGKPLTTHQWYDGTQKPWEFKRVWHVEPSLTDREDGVRGRGRCGDFRSTDGGESWHEMPGLRGHGTGPDWQPGAGGMCLHSIILDPSNPERMYIAISAAGAFRTDDGGKTWKPINKGLYSKYIPNPTADVGHCVHHIAMNPKRPGTLFMQKHWDVMRSDDAGDNWTKISGNLPTDFGFVIDINSNEPETVYVVPIKSDSEHFPLGWEAARVSQQKRWQRVGGTCEGVAGEGLLRERAARCHGGGHAGYVRRVFRYHGRTGVCLAGWWRLVERDCARSAGGVVGRSADAGVGEVNSGQR